MAKGNSWIGWRIKTLRNAIHFLFVKAKSFRHSFLSSVTFLRFFIFWLSLVVAGLYSVAIFQLLGAATRNEVIAQV